MSIIGDIRPFTEQLENPLPRAFGGCQCDCHRFPNVYHCVPCCMPSADNISSPFTFPNHPIYPPYVQVVKEPEVNMSLISTIKSAQLKARKEKDVIATSLLTTLIGDAAMVGKNNGNRETTDGEVVAIIKKFINNSEETLKLVSSSVALFGLSPNTTHETNEARKQDIVKIGSELLILNTFLPKQLSSDSLSEAIDGIIVETQATTIRDMGKVMKVLKDKYDGQYDGGLASTIAKQKLGS